MTCLCLLEVDIMEFDTETMYELAVAKVLKQANAEQLDELVTTMNCNRTQAVCDLAEYLSNHLFSYVDDNYTVHIKPNDWFYSQYKTVNISMLLFIAKN